MDSSAPQPRVTDGLHADMLRALFDDSLDAVYTLDLDGNFLQANDALLANLGVTRDQLIGTSYLPTVDGESSEYTQQQFARAVAGETVRYLTSGVRLDGTTFRADIVNTPLRVDGEVIAVLGMARDIDDLEAARREQEALVALFESTLNAVSDGLFFLNEDFVFTYVNPRGEEQAQRTREELVGRSLWDAFPLMQGSELGIGYRRAMADKVTVVTRERYEPYGTVLEATAYPTAGGIAIYVRDVTDEEASRHAISEQSAQIASQAALLDSARDAIIVRDLDNNIRFWNRAAVDLYGWSADEVVGLSVRDVIYRSTDVFDIARAATLANGEWSGDVEQVTRDGRMILADCRWSLVRSPSGEPEAIFTFNKDVTLQRQQEERQLREERLESLGTLAGGIAHDLNNVLTPLLMSVQLLAEDETDESKKSTLAVIEASAKRGAAMMRKVLEFARGVEGRRIQVNMPRFIGDVSAFCHETLPKSIEVTCTVPEDSWDAVGDPTQLLQVLINLVTNARDAMPDGGELSIAVDNVDVTDAFAMRVPYPGHYVRITVEDTGSGMAPEIEARIFEPFFTTKGVGIGTGLGLASSTSIVNSHGGAMQVASTPGAGTRFDVFVPALVTPLSETADSERIVPQVPRGDGELILIVDDELAIRHSARIALESWGYRVAVAENGQEALDYIEQFPGAIALLFSDMAMPGMGGATLLAKIDASTPALPVLLSSGMVLTTQPTGPLRGFLPKPYTAEALRAEVARLLDKS